MLDTDLLASPAAIDVHQHLWPESLLDRLRSRTRTPYLRGWRLHLAGEPVHDVDPSDHDPTLRVRLDRDAGVAVACVGLSSPLGIEALPEDEAWPLLDAWHDGLEELPGHFRGWGSVPDVTSSAAVAELLARERIVGLQVAATRLRGPSGWESVAPLLAVVQQLDLPLLVHPGPVAPAAPDATAAPGWWAPVVDYPSQLAAAWWGWQAWRGRDQLPLLRVVFAAGAGLAPLHHERHVLRGGRETPLDPLLHVDTSGYGPRAWDALLRVLGVDALVLGSDRPYGHPVAELFGEAATHAVRVTNPARLLGPQLSAAGPPTKEPAWSSQS